MIKTEQLSQQKLATNAANLEHGFAYLKQVFLARIKLHEQQQVSGEDVDQAAIADEVELPPLAFYQDGSSFSLFIEAHQPSFEEYVILLLALVPHVQGCFFDQIFEAYFEHGAPAEFGGSRQNEHRLFQPTGETALYLLAGGDLDRRFQVQQLLASQHWLAQQNIVRLEAPDTGQSYLSGRLTMDADKVEQFTVGHSPEPDFSSAFPAQKITTHLAWEELVLPDAVMNRIEDIKDWISYNATMMADWQMARKLKPGHRALFYGPSGTGKTLTATLLGEATNRSVYRVDLSTVVSKYIGETEKNLAKLFDTADGQGWILFFDEADALFGKRTAVNDAHDRYANQEVSFLLQKIEEFDGLIILASNFKTNMDDAFLRRFNSVVHFPFPTEQEREAIWRNNLPEALPWQQGDDLPKSLARYELAGGAIVNAVQYACIKSLARKHKELQQESLLDGIALELEKLGKVFRK
ncbi:ATP-binding protein [Corallincola luteus]|uniref:ATP-binding protein n=1 Tax=Corallincola luteus TaxID=1775177 RepID=A0ABY2AH88_9GAMM|nr:ATP-binding protein [Corallincola luteus]TCI01890.1 ATP-binding protein [Corallincola luteus]